MEITKIANEENIPITPRGSGSNLSGCSISKKGGIAICFTMMNKILEINKENRYAIVEPGKVLKEFQNEVETVERKVGEISDATKRRAA